MDKISKSLSGVSGEYFVAAELSRRGYIASLTMRNSKGIDILVANEEGNKTIGIQVKTNQKADQSWVLTSKNEEYNSENLIYVFVNLNDLNELPSYYIVPQQRCIKLHLSLSIKEFSCPMLLKFTLLAYTSS